MTNSVFLKKSLATCFEQITSVHYQAVSHTESYIKQLKTDNRSSLSAANTVTNTHSNRQRAEHLSLIITRFFSVLKNTQIVKRR